MHYQKIDRTQTAIAQPLQKKIFQSPTHPIEQLQSLVGNRAVNQLLENQPIVQAKPMFRGLSHELVVQPKLTIGAVGDKYEQEADRIAANVVSKIHAPQNQAIQREEMPEDDRELQMKPMVQRLGEGNHLPASPNLESSINQAKGSGESIPQRIRQPIENVLGADFSGVKVHTDDRSHQLNRSIQSKAFTTGKDIFFRQGEYNPGSRVGQELIAHELTHVMQQNGESDRAEARLQRKVLTIGDAEAEQKLYGEEGSRFLEDEQKQVIQENKESQTQENFYEIPDKWGDRSLAHHYNYFHPKRREARSHGTKRFGPRQSFHPRTKEKHLKFMGKSEDLKIIAHGSGDKVGGYTPAKLVNLLIALGLKPRHKGIIWLRGCLAARRPPTRFGSNAGKSFIEKMARELGDRGYTNQVYGLRHIAILGTQEQEYNPEKYEQGLELELRDRIWYKANPYGPVKAGVTDTW